MYYFEAALDKSPIIHYFWTDMSVQNGANKKDQKRKAFLEAARKIFSEKGFQSANVTDIVSEVRSGQGTFYYHFKDKQAIFDELMIGFVDKLLTALAENQARSAGRLALANRELAIENARRIAAVYMENMDLATLFFRESRYVGGTAMQRIEQLYTIIFSQIEAGLAEGQALGLVRADLDPRIAARCFAGAAECVIQQELRADGPRDLDHIATQIVDFQSLGVLAPAPREAHAEKHVSGS
jgi:AcrR family transcriptional regulator